MPERSEFGQATDIPERERAGREEITFGVAQTITRAVREVRRLGCFVLRNHEVVGWKVCHECEVMIALL